MNIALIPARGGSKSIKKKNIVRLGDHPLIYYTINVANKVELIDRVIVSTDDLNIKEISCSFGAEVPFIRPKAISGDNTGDFEVVDHMLQWLGINEGSVPENIIYLRPDFPFRKVKTLEKAINTYMNDKKADGLRSVQRSKEIPYKTWLIENGYLQSTVDYNNVRDAHNTARQFFPQTYWPIGYIEIFDSQFILDNSTLRGERMIPFIIEEEKCINIGSIIDLQKAERLIKHYMKNSVWNQECEVKSKMFCKMNQAVTVS